IDGRRGSASHLPLPGDQHVMDLGPGQKDLLAGHRAVGVRDLRSVDDVDEAPHDGLAAGVHELHREPPTRALDQTCRSRARPSLLVASATPAITVCRFLPEVTTKADRFSATIRAAASTVATFT